MNETLDVIRQLDNNDMDASILKDQMRQIASSKLPSFALTEAASSNMDLDWVGGTKVFMIGTAIEKLQFLNRYLISLAQSLELWTQKQN